MAFQVALGDSAVAEVAATKIGIKNLNFFYGTFQGLRNITLDIPERQVTLVSGMNRLDYLKSHSEVDIILDTFPYPGGTTTCDALWMGVPTVTLAGDSMLSRQGVSLLTCAGLPEWIAQSEDAYVMIAVNKSKDITGLCRLRSTLRAFLFGSPLFNAPRFSQELLLVMENMVKEKAAERLG